MPVSGEGFFGDLVDGISTGIKLLGGRVSILEKMVGAPKLTQKQYVERFDGSGLIEDIQKTVNAVAKSPITHAAISAALPIAFKALAGKLEHIEDHVHGSAYKTAGKATIKKHGGAYETAGKVAKKKKRGGDEESESEYSSEEDRGGKAKKKKHGGA